MRFVWAGIVLLSVGLALAAAWNGLKSIPVSMGYLVEAEFEELPPDDSAMEAWLKTQPGVAVASVYRREGEPKVVVVDFIQVRDLRGRPPFPDLEAKCDELGYRGRVGRFHDSKRRGEPVYSRKTVAPEARVQ